MLDTNRDIETLYKTMLMEQSGEERMIMGASMFDTAIKFIEASLPKNLSETEKKKQIFFRLYKNNFNQDELNLILDWFDKIGERISSIKIYFLS